MAVWTSEGWRKEAAGHALRARVGRMIESRWLAGTLTGLGVAAILAIAVGGAVTIRPLLTPMLLALLVLAYASELLALGLPQHRMRIAFSLPFVAGVAVHYGPWVAVAFEAIAALLALLTRCIVRRSRPKVADWLDGVGVSVGCVAVASLAPAVLVPRATLTIEGSVEGVLLFAICCGLVHLLWAWLLGAQRPGWHALRRVLGSPIEASFVAATYIWGSVTVAVLVAEGRTEWLASALLPVLALRFALRAKAQMDEHYYETIVALSLMLRRVHPYTHSHLDRVARIAEDVALRLGVSPERARRVREAAILHDIGKIAIDEKVLDKPGPLDAEELAHVRRHCDYGAQILAASTQLRDIAAWVRHHHERPDGNGYPTGLQGDAIPLESRIIAVVDAFDAMVGGDAPGERRPYRDRMGVHEATAELVRCSGTQFDPKVVAAFLDALDGVRVA